LHALGVCSDELAIFIVTDADDGGKVAKAMMNAERRNDE